MSRPNPKVISTKAYQEILAEKKARLQADFTAAAADQSEVNPEPPVVIPSYSAASSSDIPSWTSILADPLFIDRLDAQVAPFDPQDYMKHVIFPNDMFPLALIETHYTCVVCFGLLVHLVACPAGHSVCRRCVLHMEKVECPTCKGSFRIASDLPNTSPTSMVLSNLPIRCPRRPYCTWTGTFGVEGVSLMEHVNERCLWRRDTCRNGDGDCSLDTVAGALDLHKAECPFRKVACSHCTTWLGIVDSPALHAHEAACPSKIVTCLCGETMTQGQLTVHMDDHCPESEVVCELCVRDPLSRDHETLTTYLRKNKDAHFRDRMQVHAIVIHKEEDARLRQLARRPVQPPEEVVVPKRAKVEVKSQDWVFQPDLIVLQDDLVIDASNEGSDCFWSCYALTPRGGNALLILCENRSYELSISRYPLTQSGTTDVSTSDVRLILEPFPKIERRRTFQLLLALEHIFLVSADLQIYRTVHRATTFFDSEEPYPWQTMPFKKISSSLPGPTNGFAFVHPAVVEVCGCIFAVRVPRQPTNIPAYALSRIYVHEHGCTHPRGNCSQFSDTPLPGSHFSNGCRVVYKLFYNATMHRLILWSIAQSFVVNPQSVIGHELEHKDLSDLPSQTYSAGLINNIEPVPGIGLLSEDVTKVHHVPFPSLRRRPSMDTEIVLRQSDTSFIVIEVPTTLDQLWVWRLARQ